MKKRLVSLVLVLSLVLGSMSMGFAAGNLTTGIEDSKVVSAVERLAAFGIVNGMEDGQYHPELKVTREQFAKLLVEAMGLGSAANAAKGATKFSDVEADRWSAGYVNVASGQGILKGYPDGTFGPAKEVTYAEALTMLVRALGYQDSFLPGNWPGNYVAKAASLGITSGVNFSSDSLTADRGSVAVMVNNTLDAKIVKVSEFSGEGIKYTETDVTLLADKLEIDKYDGLRFVENQRINDSLDSNELVFKALDKQYEDNKIVGQNVDKNDDTDAIEVADGVDKENLLGMKVKIYVNDDDEIVYMEKDGNEKVVIDQIDEISGKEISLYVLDDDYTLASNASAYIAGVDNKIKSADEAADFVAGEFGRFIISGSEIVFADVVKADKTGNTGMVVTEIDKANKELTGIVAGAGTADPDDSFAVDLEDDYDATIIFDAKSRAALSFDDIAVDDVVYVTSQTIDGDDYAIVQVVKDNKVEGEFGKYKADEAVIGGKSYDLTKVGASVYTTVSANKNDDIASYTKEFSTGTLLEDVYGEKVTALTDVVGRVAHVVTDAEATSGSMYGVVKMIYDVSGTLGTTQTAERVKLYVASEDKLITYTLAEEKDAKKLEVGQFVKFKLNKDGEIADGKLTIADKVTDKFTIAKDTELGKDTIKADGKTFSVDAKSTVLVNAPKSTDYPIDIDPSDCEPVVWADIAEDTIATATDFVAFYDDKTLELDAVLFVKGLESTSDEEALYMVDAYKQDGDTAATVDIYDGKVEDLVVDSATAGKAADKMVAVAKKQGDGELEILAYVEDGNVKTLKALKDFTIKHGTVAAKDGDFIYLVKGGDAYKLASDTIVYEKDVKKSKSNISVGDTVDLVLADGKNVRVAKIYASSEIVTEPTTTQETGIVTNITTTAGDESIVVDNKTPYFLNAKTILEDKDGNVLAMGVTAVIGAIAKGDQVTVSTSGDIMTIKITKTAQELVNAVAGDVATTFAATGAVGAVKVPTVPTGYTIAVNTTSDATKYDTDGKIVAAGTSSVVYTVTNTLSGKTADTAAVTVTVTVE